MAQNAAFLLAFCFGLIGAMGTLAFTLVWATDRSRRYALNWALAFATASVTALAHLITLAEGLAAQLMRTVDGIGLLAASCLLLVGVRQNVGWRPAWALMVTPTATAAVIVAWLSLFAPLFLADRIVLAVTLAILWGVAGATFWVAARDRPLSRRGTAVLLWLLALHALVYLGMLLGAMDPAEPLGPGLGLLGAATTALTAGLITGLALTVATDLRERLTVVSRTDHLTEIANRSHFFAMVGYELARKGRYPSGLAMIVGDTDHHRSLNERFGQAKGDLALQAFVDTIVRESRRCDTVDRISSQEFAILLPNTDLHGAEHLAERIRMRLRGVRFHPDDPEARFTASFGVSAAQTDDDFDSFLNRTLAALAQAKLAGRDRTVLAPTQDPERLQAVQ